MTSSTRQVLLVVAVLLVAGIAYGIWERFFSHGAQIDAIHAKCVTAFDAGKATMKAELPRPGDKASPGARDMAAGLGKLIDEVAGGVSVAACGVIRESCRLDFDGEVCRRAREQYNT